MVVAAAAACCLEPTHARPGHAASGRPGSGMCLSCGQVCCLPCICVSLPVGPVARVSKLVAKCCLENHGDPTT